MMKQNCEGRKVFEKFFAWLSSELVVSARVVAALDKRGNSREKRKMETMAREKVKKVKGMLKKMMATMSVTKKKAPAPKYIVSQWWLSPTDFVIKTRPNPDYKQQ
jgi:hypothetical protein